MLRRPPLGHVLATAHDMGREYRIIAALGPDRGPRAAGARAVHRPDVNGAPFYVMGFVDGNIVRNPNEATAALDEAGRWRAGQALVEVLVAHPLGRRRAPSVWATSARPRATSNGSCDAGTASGTSRRHRELPLVDEVHDGLASCVPEQGPATIVHGDYRLDNCLLDGAGDVLAVLDWELCTLGDPLADLGLLLVYWTEAGDPETAPARHRHHRAGVRDPCRRRRVVCGAVGPRPVHHRLLRRVRLLEAVLHPRGRLRPLPGGVMREEPGFEEFADRVVWLAESAADAAERLPTVEHR